MGEQSTSRQAERRDKRRRDILDVASRLFSAKGYENVTLRGIAEELGYAHATLYRYFPDKQHLLGEICQETFALLTDKFDSVAAANADPAERLLETSRAFVRFGLAHPQHFRIVFFGPEDRSGLRAGEYINEIGRPLFSRIVGVFQDYSRSADLPEAENLLDAHTWWGAIFGITQVLITQGELPHLSAPAQVTERLIELLFYGLQKRSWKRSKP